MTKPEITLLDITIIMIYRIGRRIKRFLNVTINMERLLFAIAIAILVLTYVTKDERIIAFWQTQKENITATLGLLVGGILIFSKFLVQKSTEIKVEKFTDIDNKSEAKAQKIAYMNAMEKLNRLEEREQSSKEELEKIIEKIKAEQQNNSDQLYINFTKYFDSIRKSLEDKAENADEKASRVLDRGTAFAHGGISFFISSIFIWQALSFIFGFRTQYIYGIASCSILFLFIEFLSAWFLKQYRPFIETSTYLFKVKSTFDKHMLLYLAANETHSENAETSEKRKQLISVLKNDIKWPDPYRSTDTDVSFAKEACEALNMLAKNIKSDAKKIKKAQKLNDNDN